ncbi:hypothetical protein GGD81_004023 [Rhodobium orientis]|uniref:Globin-sensor domain-containing protein n=1 Tax=Rhodobium orientis TaxID=34017 RepID=A0A327JQF8_9HYPH|nr:protoglobin domain-containing protein [Rhodobium orientis]MBB4304958.1 hypothetical protein [Rhodobium orientis]MBK5951277.1 hypothetical protein [Rhodobium orientis]RAI27112.1 hypothetical protein CH339_11615 [Rhodobium orientis]
MTSHLQKTDHRTAEACAFIRLEREDTANGRIIWSLLEHRMDAILDVCFSRITQNGTADMDNDRTVDFFLWQVDHWRRLFTGAMDEAYAAGIRRTGVAHNLSGVDLRWYTVVYTTIANEIVKVIAMAFEGDGRKIAALVGTLSRHIAVDSQMTLSAYNAHLVD